MPVGFAPGTTLLDPGSLLFVNGESGVAEIQAPDEGTGAIVETLVSDYGVSHVVGGTHHPGRGTPSLVQDRVLAGVASLSSIAIEDSTGEA